MYSEFRDDQYCCDDKILDAGSLFSVELDQYEHKYESKIKICRGKGCYLYDDKGNAYLDCAAGTFNLSLGYSHPDVLAAAKSQMDNLVHLSSSFHSDIIERLNNKLSEIAPAGLQNVHLKSSGGSTCNEGAIKLAQLKTKKSDIITLFRSHAGQTIHTTQISGNSFRRADFNFSVSGALHVPAPYCYRCFYKQCPENCNLLCVERIHDFINYASSGQVAGMLVEPVLGNGDNVVCSTAYLRAVRKLCDEYKMSLIFDEVQTGIGRTGEMFAAQTFGVTPDIITTAKGLGGSGFQIAAILSNEEHAHLDSHQHAFTFGGNLMAAAAALKTLELVSESRFLANIRATGDYILKRLRESQSRYKFIGEVRGVGLMIGFEIVDQQQKPDLDLTNKIKHLAQEYGLLLRTSRYHLGNVLKIRPPLILTMDEAVFICDNLDAVFAKVGNV
ncbi:MAG: aspartate aminotransferase family protein [Oligoflexia bacterium]|nr:aspartate aminotransferase family protein [Oligoflexia bacterium]